MTTSTPKKPRHDSSKPHSKPQENAVAPDGLSWASLYADILSEESSMSLDALTAALTVRGHHALAEGPPLPQDGRLRDLPHADLLRAAFEPELALLELRHQDAAERLADPNDATAQEAAEALASVIDDAERWALRLDAITAIDRPAVASRGRETLRALEERLLATPDLDELLPQVTARLGATLGEAQATPAKSPDLWHRVAGQARHLIAAIPPLPKAADHDDSLDEPTRALADTLRKAPRITDDDLVVFAMGEADPAQEDEILAAIESDDVMRSRYDAILGDVAAWHSVSPEASKVVNLKAWALFRDLATTERTALPKAPRHDSFANAAADAHATYGSPSDEALIYTFDDTSEVYAEVDGLRWLVRVYPQSKQEASTRMTTTGEVDLPAWIVGANAVLHAHVDPNTPIRVHCGDAVVQVTLPEIPHD